jgi:hypothetical protein
VLFRDIALNCFDTYLTHWRRQSQNVHGFVMS